MKNNETELMLHQPLPVATVEAGLSIAEVFKAVCSQDINAEKVAVMKELLAMDAKRKFNEAFVKLQTELPTIVAESVIPNRGKYAKFEDVMDKIGPMLKRNGFSVSFSQSYDGVRIIETCLLNHSGGHSQSNSFAVRVSGKADSETQADCKAATTAKRNALLNALNIVIRQDCLISDEDASNDGGYITAAQAEELAHRVNMTNSDKPKFFALADAKDYKSIPAGKYAMLDAILARKEREGA